MFCSKCGKEIIDETVICPNCGELINNKQEKSIARHNGIVLMVLGIILILVQLLGSFRSILSGDAFDFQFNNFLAFTYSLLHFVGYWLIGITGLILLIYGIVLYNKSFDKASLKQSSDRFLIKTLSICHLLPIASLIIGVNFKSSFSETEIFYFVPIFTILVSGALLLSCVKQHKLSNLFTIISSLTLIYSNLPIWNIPLTDVNHNDVTLFFGVVTYFSTFTLTIISIFLSIKVSIKAYHQSSKYKVKVYEKLEKANKLQQRGIISQEEFDDLKNKLTKDFK